MAGQTIVQEIAINAPAERIFEALINPEQRSSSGARQAVFKRLTWSPICVGGRWKMSGEGFGRPFTVTGECRAIERPRLLAFTWLPSWQANATETLVRFELSETNGVTSVRVIHSGLTPDGAEAHKGWPQIFDWLRRFAER